ncbi:MAG: hypothetical protein EA378_07100 [Phycisphaerales bacterium]|nr:MAG: hypothetical protein EA378_07100 [Phycisphaerales bacterium]
MDGRGRGSIGGGSTGFRRGSEPSWYEAARRVYPGEAVWGAPAWNASALGVPSMGRGASSCGGSGAS